MFLDEKTLLEMWLHPGLNLTIFQGTGRAQGIFFFSDHFSNYNNLIS